MTADSGSKHGSRVLVCYTDRIAAADSPAASAARDRDAHRSDHVEIAHRAGAPELSSTYLEVSACRIWELHVNIRHIRASRETINASIAGTAHRPKRTRDEREPIDCVLVLQQHSISLAGAVENVIYPLDSLGGELSDVGQMNGLVCSHGFSEEIHRLACVLPDVVFVARKDHGYIHLSLIPVHYREEFGVDGVRERVRLVLQIDDGLLQLLHSERPLLQDDNGGSSLLEACELTQQTRATQ